LHEKLTICKPVNYAVAKTQRWGFDWDQQKQDAQPGLSVNVSYENIETELLFGFMGFRLTDRK